jgi:hypothetical protein
MDGDRYDNSQKLLVKLAGGAANQGTIVENDDVLTLNKDINTNEIIVGDAGKLTPLSTDARAWPHDPQHSFKTSFSWLLLAVYVRHFERHPPPPPPTRHVYSPLRTTSTRFSLGFTDST